MAVGSAILSSSAVLANTPNPSGILSYDTIITPSFLIHYSDIEAICALRTWFPYKKFYSPVDFNQIFLDENLDKKSIQVIWSLNLPLFENYPKHTPAWSNSFLPNTEHYFIT